MGYICSRICSRADGFQHEEPDCRWFLALLAPAVVQGQLGCKLWITRAYAGNLDEITGCNDDGHESSWNSPSMIVRSLISASGETPIASTIKRRNRRNETRSTRSRDRSLIPHALIHVSLLIRYVQARDDRGVMDQEDLSNDENAERSFAVRKRQREIKRD